MFGRRYAALIGNRFTKIVVLIPILLPTISFGQSPLPRCEGDNSQWNYCYGSKIMLGGSKYVGEFKNGLPHGYGTLSHKNGKYVGEFIDNRLEGRGTEPA